MKLFSLPSIQCILDFCFYLDWCFRKQFCLRALNGRGFVLPAFGATWHAVYAIEMGAFPNWGNLSAMFICTQDVGVSLCLNVISLCQLGAETQLLLSGFFSSV